MGILKSRIRGAVAIVIAMLPAFGVLSAVSTTPASADGPTMTLPATGVVTVTATVVNPGEEFTDSIFVAGPTPQTSVCSPCSASSPSTISLGVVGAGTPTVIGTRVANTGDTYYSNGSVGDNPGPGATVTQVNTDEWSVAFEDQGTVPTPDIVVTVTDNVALGTAYLDALLGSSNPAANIPFACGADPVNCATGNYTETATDITVPGRGPALDLSRTYNSLNAATPSPFGNGWSDSYAMSLDDNTSSGFVTVTQENGSARSRSSDSRRPHRRMARYEHVGCGKLCLSLREAWRWS